MPIHLKKLEMRVGYVGNWMSAKPASWEVLGTDYRILGRAGAFPSYDLYKGGTYTPSTGQVGGVRIRHTLSFEDAKALVEQLLKKSA